MINKENATGTRPESKDEIQNYISTSLVDLVTKKIKDNIYSGKYPPGQRLIVRELSDDLNVSHTPVKDALNRLVAEGYVEALPRRSMVVKEYTNDDFIDNLSVRLMCELFCAYDVIETAKVDSSLLSDLNCDYNAMTSCLSDSDAMNYETWVLHETHFHRRYIHTSGNRKLIETYEKLDSNRNSYFVYLKNTGTPLTAHTFQQDLSEHKAIIDAIAAFSKVKFQKAVANHILHACDEYAINESAKKKIQELRNSYDFLISGTAP